MIKFILSEGAKLPERGSRFAAGLDIHSLNDIVVPAGGRVLVSTGVKLADCPIGSYLRVAPRSKLAYKFGIDVLAGVVDCDYRGEIGVILFNTSSDDYFVGQGDAVAQLIVEQISVTSACEVTEATPTERGEAGIHSKELRK